MSGRSVSANTGGGARRKLMTAYRESALAVAVTLELTGPASPKNLRLRGAPEKTLSILSGNPYGWFEHLAKALYSLTPKGMAALEEADHAEIVAALRRRRDALTPDYIKALTFSATKRDGTVEKVRLSDIASVREGQSLPTVLRAEQRRYLPVSITISEDSNITLVTQDVEGVMAGLTLPAGVTYEVTGESATIMDAFEQLGLMLILGLGVFTMGAVR